MTEGHKHRLITVRYPHRWYVRALRWQFFHSRDLNRVERSPYPYGPCSRRDGACEGHRDCWGLSTLSVLHKWTGLTLYFERPDEGSLDSGQRGSTD